MKAFCVALLGAAMVVCAGTAHGQDDNAKKIVGTWELTKAGGDLPVGTVIEFTKDLKLTATIKGDGKDEKIDGTYKIDKDKLTVKVSFMGQSIEETATIKKLSDEALEIEDKDKKVDVFKKKK